MITSSDVTLSCVAAPPAGAPAAGTAPGADRTPVAPPSQIRADAHCAAASPESPVAREDHTACQAGGSAPARLIAVPLERVRFLQAMAEDGPGARPCRVAGLPVQQPLQRTLC